MLEALARHWVLLMLRSSLALIFGVTVLVWPGLRLSGLVLLAYAPSYAVVLVAAALVGTGSSIFHPESSRVARMASGGRHGLAQSLFQVGGNTGSALGPLLAAAVIVPFGQHSMAWFGLAAMVAIVLLLQVSRWYAVHHVAGSARSRVFSNHMRLRESILPLSHSSATKTTREGSAPCRSQPRAGSHSRKAAPRFGRPFRKPSMRARSCV